MTRISPANLVLALGSILVAVVLACSIPVTAAAEDATSTTPGEDATLTPPASVPTGTTQPTATPVATGTCETIGKSAKGRAIVVRRFGAGSRRILYVGGVHGNEYGCDVAKAFAAYLATHPSVVPSGTEISVVLCANPDGHAARTRANANGVDLNRNFPARNWTRRHLPNEYPGRRGGSEPETQVLMKLMKDHKPIRVISLHSKGGLIDYDGPGGLTIAKRISAASGVKVHRLTRSGGFPGSMGSYVPERLRIPLVTWELSSRQTTRRVLSGLCAALR